MIKKFRTALPMFVAALLATAFVATPVRAADDKKESVLGTEMEAMGKSLKALKKSSKDAANKEESLKHVADLKKQSIACKTEIPKVVAKAPEGERAKLTEGYVKMMDDVIAELDKLEKAVTAGDADATQASIKALKVLEETGHEKYNP